MAAKNILYVIADQHNAGWLGCEGHRQVHTPHLDAFAGEGVRFTGAYAQNPICTPSRVSILSGQYCLNHGYYGLSGPAPRCGNAFRHFRAQGYRTAAFGKLHLPESPRNWIADDVERFGDTYETADGVIHASVYFEELEAKGIRHLEDSYHNPHHYGKASIARDARPSELPYEMTQEYWCMREALRFIDEGEGGRPFFLQVALQRPHHPLLPQQRFWDWYAEDLALPPTLDQDPSGRPPHFRKGYDWFREMPWEYAGPGDGFYEGARRAWRGTLACVSQIDDVFGRLLEGLRERGLDEDTIIVYGSDHGAYHGIHGIPEKSPGICSEEVCRVPMIWQVPGCPKGRVETALAENIDIFPTLAALCGLPEPQWTDGRDLSPLLRGEDGPVRELAVTENVWSRAIRWGRWRFVHYQPETFDDEAFADYGPTGDYGELYDIEADPDEMRNLYYDKAYAEVVHACRRKLLEWMIRSRRSVTSLPAVREATVPVERAESPDYPGERRSYPVEADGTAPNDAQPRNRPNVNRQYL